MLHWIEMRFLFHLVGKYMREYNICGQNTGQYKRYPKMPHPFSKWDEVQLVVSLLGYRYTAKLLFHQSPTRYSDYTVAVTVTM